MEHIILPIEPTHPQGYSSQYVADILEGHKLKASAIVVVNLYEDEHLIRIKVAGSGFSHDDFQMEIRNGNLFIYAEKSANPAAQGNCCAIDIDTFSKSFKLPSTAALTYIKAYFVDDLLLIDIPKY